MATIYAPFLGISVDTDEVSRLLASRLGVTYHLTPLAIKCTYPVFRGEAAGHSPVFVKIGLITEWRRTREILRQIGACDLFSRFLTDEPLMYQDWAVFAMAWRDFTSVAVEDMSEAQIDGWLEGCRRTSEALQQVTEFTPLAGTVADPEASYETVHAFVRHHPLLGLLLRSLVNLPPAQRTYGTRPRVVVHGDFHARNYGFAGDRLAAVCDFDKLTQGIACTDAMNAVLERASRMGLKPACRAQLLVVARQIFARLPYSLADCTVAINAFRLNQAAARLRKHPHSPLIAFDIRRRDSNLSELLQLLPVR